MEAADLAEHDVVALVARRDDPVGGALEGDRRALDPRRRDDLVRRLAQADGLELVDLGVELGRAAVRLVGVRQRDEVVQNSPVPRMFTNVSFSSPSERGCIDSDTTGGTRPTTVRNEIGARFATPVVDTVLTQPITRGRTLPMRSL
nr:hypothetical protein [Pseudonocardia oceani]